MIYIARDGTQSGPFPVDHINQMLATGQLRPTDLAWWEGASGWVPVLQAAGVRLPEAGDAASAPSPQQAATASASVSASAAPGSSVVAATPGPQSVYAPPRATLVPGATAAGQVSAGSVQALRETRPWVLLLAILGVIVTGLMLLGGFGILVGGMMTAGSAGGSAMGLMAVMGVAYLLFALLYLYPVIKLFKYSAAISRLSRTGTVGDLEEALRQQRSFWRILGIVTLVVMALYVVMILVAVVGGASLFNSVRPSSPAPYSSPASP